MISLEDCIAMCGLHRDEVLALAEHEHIPEIAAAPEPPEPVKKPAPRKKGLIRRLLGGK